MPREALNDPVLEETGKIGTMTLEDGSHFRLLRSPAHTSSHVTADEPGPHLGENTVEILRKAGYSDAEIERLREIGVI